MIYHYIQCLAMHTDNMLLQFVFQILLVAHAVHVCGKSACHWSPTIEWHRSFIGFMCAVAMVSSLALAILSSIRPENISKHYSL